jgi:hypothetical protein
MPFSGINQQIREHVQAVILDVAGYLATVPDSDGDYPLQRHSTSVFGRLVHDRQPARFQVFAVVLHDVEQSAELLRELNDLNASIDFARIFVIDRQVLVEVDLVAGTLDADELRVAIRAVPMMAAVHGGVAIQDPKSFRWQSYREAIIEAEITPGSDAILSGDDAVGIWPFPSTIHVLTAWNPQGVNVDDDYNERAQIELASNILRSNGRFVHGRRRDIADTHSESSLIVWGLTRDDAITLGRHARQDAFFEIDANEVRLISCTDQTVEIWPRISTPLTSS